MFQWGLNITLWACMSFSRKAIFCCSYLNKLLFRSGVKESEVFTNLCWNAEGVRKTEVKGKERNYVHLSYMVLLILPFHPLAAKPFYRVYNSVGLVSTFLLQFSLNYSALQPVNCVHLGKLSSSPVSLRCTMPLVCLGSRTPFECHLLQRKAFCSSLCNLWMSFNLLNIIRSN